MIDFKKYYYETIFRLSIEDFESILGRKLTQNEIDKIESKFEIEDWSEYIKTFFDVYDIK